MSSVGNISTTFDWPPNPAWRCCCPNCSGSGSNVVFVPQYHPQPLSLVERFEQLVLEKARLEEDLKEARYKIDELEGRMNMKWMEDIEE